MLFRSITPDSYSAVIEISKGSKNKYELDKHTGLLRLDRILYTATHYPANYGFIPLTYADDFDPLDTMVLCSESIRPLTLVQVYPIGVIRMTDAGYPDEKILAIPFADPIYNGYKSVFELPSHVFDEICHFFTVYKQLEDKKTVVDELAGAEDAKQIITRAMENYQKLRRQENSG